MDQAAEAMDSAHRKGTGEKGWESANLVQSGQEELEQGDGTTASGLRTCFVAGLRASPKG
jgi:hypothetical protein